MAAANGSDDSGRVPDDLGRWDWLTERLDQLRETEAYRRLVPRATSAGVGRLSIGEGRHTLINFGSNDYLGLAHERSAGVRGKASKGSWLCGSGASPLVTGYSPTHAKLEQAIAELEGTEAAVVLPTGYAANVALLSTLPEEGDLILSDELNHASIIDGCRLSRAERFIYPHVDVKAIEGLLQAHRQRF